MPILSVWWLLAEYKGWLLADNKGCLLAEYKRWLLAGYKAQHLSGYNTHTKSINVFNHINCIDFICKVSLSEG